VGILTDEPTINLEAAKRSLIGTLVGDSLGLPYEKLPKGRNLRLMPFPLRQRICFGRGFPSDDTLLSLFVLQSLVECGSNEDKFVARFARRLRTWFLSLPPGIGLSTVKACMRLCVRVNPRRSGIKSAGNGAAMRAAVLGAALCDDEEQRARFV
jgi:ADP-ribosylglycohydrolase